LKIQKELLAATCKHMVYIKHQASSFKSNPLPPPSPPPPPLEGKYATFRLRARVSAMSLAASMRLTSMYLRIQDKKKQMNQFSFEEEEWQNKEHGKFDFHSNGKIMENTQNLQL
jgi:hypothetical protein